MSIKKITNYTKLISTFFSDKNLTKKATLNTLASSLDYVAKLIVGFIIVPLMVTGLGDYFYGVWQILNRVFGYLSTTAGSSSPLEWTLAKDQAKKDYDLKRRYVSSALLIWGFFLPITGIIGGAITWFLPYWLDTPTEYFYTIRAVAIIFVVMISTTSFSFLPYAILRGQNQAYRRIGLSVLLLFLNGGLTWLALYLETGIIGVAIAYLIQDLIVGGFYLLVCKKYIHWFGLGRPSYDLIKRFFKLSWWFLANRIVINIATSSDVVVLGFLSSVEIVPTYTLTKYIPEIMVSIVAIMVVGGLPGLGGIIGDGDFKKASEVRGEIFTITWLIVIMMGTAVLLWNRIFLGLWVGSNRYAGTFPNLLIIIAVTQFVLIRTDSTIIDLTLRIQQKVLFGLLSALISILIGGVLVKIFEMGIIGVSIGMIVGRSILNIAYPKIVSRYLGISFWSQIKNTIRPLIVTAILFSLVSLIDNLAITYRYSGIKGWTILIIGAGITACIVFVISFFTGLSRKQQKKVLSRLSIILST